MPVFNAGRYLAEAVESVLAQTLHDWELVAVDDGSSDGSLDVLRRFEERDGRVRVIARPHTGIVGARNDGIAAARGGLIAGMDQDDVMLPERLALQSAYFGEHPECALLGGASLLIDPDGDPLIERRGPTEHEALERELLQGRNPLVQPAVMMRRQAVLTAGGYREEANFAEDYDLYLRLAEVGRLAALPQLVLKHRQHLGRASFETFERQRQVVGAALAEAYARRGLAGPVPEIPASWHPNTRRGFHIRCCNDAWDGGHAATARKHAARLLALNPFSPRAWDLMARVFVGGRAYNGVVAVKTLLKRLT